MNFQEITAKLGIENYSEKLIDVYENLDQVCVDPCDAEAIEKIEQEFHVLREYYDLALKAAAEIKADPIRYAWAKTVATAIKTKTVVSGKLIPMPKPDETLAGDWLPYLVLVPSIPDTIAFYEKMGFKGEDVERVRVSFYNCIGATEKRQGRPGYTRSYFNWELNYIRGALFRFQSFNYELKELPEVYILKNCTTGEILPLMGTQKFHRSGMVLGSAGFEEEDGAFETKFEETEDAYLGYPSINNLVVNELCTYSKTEWECVLRPGDHVVSVHIPAKTDLSPEAVEKSYKEGLEFIDKFYPDFKPKAYFCCSWLLDPHLEELLGPQSKIAQFMNGFKKWPHKSAGKEIFGFVFIGFKGDYKDLPEDTSLMRKLKERYLAGEYIHGYAGVLFR